MDRPPSSPDSEFVPTFPRPSPRASRYPGLAHSLFNSLRTQLISGLIFTLPIVITFWIVYWIFMTLEAVPLEPGRRRHPPDSGLDEAHSTTLQELQAARLVVQRRVTRAGPRARCW